MYKCDLAVTLLFLRLTKHHPRSMQSSWLQLMRGTEALQCVQDLLGGHRLAPAGFPPGKQIGRVHAAR